MDDCYLITLNIQNQWYIELQKYKDGYSLSAYESIKEATGIFSRFKEKILAKDYEPHISGSLGILNSKPHILAVPRNNPSILEQYITDKKPYSVKGSMLGLFVDFTGMKVTDSILELSVIDVASTYINELYA